MKSAGAYRRLIVTGEATDPVRNNFDALRLAMALLVIWSHSFAIHSGSERGEWLSLMLHGIYNAGNIGVMAFFVISGFLIMQSYDRSRGASAYFQKRIRRIYPGYMVATTISSCAFLYFIAPAARVNWATWPTTIGMNLLLRNYSPAPDSRGFIDGGLLSINGALWSIPYEFWCYIGVAVLGAMLLLRYRWFLVMLVILVMGIHVVMDVLGANPGLGVVGRVFGQPYLWTQMAPCFLLGMVAYAFRASLPRSRALLVGLSAAAILACWLHEDLGFAVFLPSLAYGIFYVAFSDTIPLHNAARFGDFSYGTYLYGFLIQMTLELTIGRSWGLAEYFAVSAALALIAGVLSWHLVEKRFLPRRLSKNAQGHRDRVPVTITG